ncbi:DUF397 domain-containing protein [Amycolatopsis vastitatis]|uniref:DUF397 domain-containing protein n=1 Tax=Amycolatopsis vastitatis TaxID=1905142 RepID=A0A229TIP2_9PSEU|nr:DUF397 domain-containing protein [Amycolatopsis vastitatis]OXM70599.1 DUF397 domain-containing protein [Amycolatopsis vastitatis]
MSTVDTQWVRSSYSTSGEGSNCVEVAFCAPVAIRDSKAPEGELHLSAAAWTAFLTKSGGR